MKPVVLSEEVERVARMYKRNTDAANALGITMPSFGRLCRRHGIETPYVRKRRLRQRTKPRGGKA